MDELDRRQWVVPRTRGWMHGIDLALLDPADADERGLLIQAEHPELQQAIDQDVDEIEIGGVTISPRLHLSMHEIVANQLWDDEPPETWQTARRLLALGHGRHDVLHMLGSAVAGELWHVTHEGVPFDHERFVGALDALPGSWGEDDSEPPGEEPTPPPVTEAELAAMPPGVMLERCADQDAESAAAEMQAWRTAYGGAADAELARFCRSTPDPGLRMLAFAAFDPGDPASVEVVRELREDPRTRPSATLWLAEHGFEKLPALDAATPAMFVEALAVLLAHGGPEEVADALDALGPVEEQVAVLGRLWRVDNPYTADVLDAVAAAHPSKVVAKAARKGKFKLVSARR